jgi:Tol biopolymer transport system component
MRRRIVVLGLLAVLGCSTGVFGQAHLLSKAPDQSPANHDSTQPRVSADGLRIVFTSKASNLVAGDTNGKDDVFLWDGRANPAAIVRLSVSTTGAQADGPSENPSISADGNIVAFNSTATNLGAPDTSGWSNVYVREIDGPQATWTTTWVSRPRPGAVPNVPNSHCGRPSISSVGLVAFECMASNMVANDTNGVTDVFVARVEGFDVERVSTRPGNVEAKNGYSQYPSISADGNLVAFESYSNTLVTGAASGDTNNCPDIFVKNRATGDLRRLNAFHDVQPNGSSLRPSMSGNGRFVVFESQAYNMSSDAPPPTFWEVYRYDLQASLQDPDAVTLVSTTEFGGFRASVNQDGSKVAYETADQIYIWDEGTTDTRLNFQASGTVTAEPTNGLAIQAALAPATQEVNFVVFSSNASNLDDPTNGKLNIFVRAIARSVQDVTPMTIVAEPATLTPPLAPSKAIFTNVDLGLDNSWNEYVDSYARTVFVYEMGMGIRPSPLATSPAPPAVTVGGVAAKGVSTSVTQTLRFAAPLLPDGSSNIVIVTFADGEVIKLPVRLKAMALTSNPTGDNDHDTLPNWWELTYGLDPNDVTDASTVQSNGLTPVQSLAQQHHPTATAYRHLAEGATGSLFQTRVALANPDALPAMALLRYLKPDGTVQTQPMSVPAMGRATVDVETVAGMSSAEFSTTVESDLPLIVDRTMRWGGTASYGAHTETAVATPALTWYMAEGATHNAFNLFYLLQNPNGTDAQVRVRYLRPVGDPLEKTYVLRANSRTNIWVDLELFPGLGQALASTDVSAVFEVLNGQPIIVERAMYADVTGQTFGAGHESAGITAPALQWFLAEGATGPYFDLFVLIANPGATLATIQATYLLPDGRTLVKDHAIAPSSRFNIWVDYEDPQLANTAVSTTIRSTNGVPIIVERAMWWPGSAWYEAHNSPGATTTGTRWALAEGEAGGPRGVETYILIANTSDAPATVKVTLLFEDGTNAEQTYPGLPARSRFNVPVGAFFPQAAGKRFGALVESLGETPALIVVERAMYWDAPGQPWAAGTNALATKLQ